ncbi:hypothetical protein BHE74_00051913 [Ensete ventricosum]|nr:hypothetical protein BHE74_00051913 [Ensete ventricosum]RZS19020.1 hypothetical protein BHM03_00051367 [Ensete ventricosum]
MTTCPTSLPSSLVVPRGVLGVVLLGGTSTRLACQPLVSRRLCIGVPAVAFRVPCLGRSGDGERLGGRSPRVRLGRSATGVSELGSGVRAYRSGRCKSFYSGYYRSFIPEIFNASMAYHAVVLLHTVRGPCSEVRVLPTAAMACRPYPCQVDRIIVGSTIPVSGWFCCVVSATLEI